MPKPQGRHELKHFINYADLLQLRTRLQAVASVDANAIDANGYRVRSLYFDNYHDQALREKIDGVDRREKFRLRLYNGDTSFIRLEKKSKRNGISMKEKTVLPVGVCQRLLAGVPEVLLAQGSPLASDLYVKMRSQHLRPASLVEYWREAFIYEPGNVRITLDYHIRTSPTVFAFLEPEPLLLPVSDVYILEVKYDGFLPEIMRDLVSLSSRRNSAFSKYAVSRIV